MAVPIPQTTRKTCDTPEYSNLESNFLTSEFRILLLTFWLVPHQNIYVQETESFILRARIYPSQGRVHSRQLCSRPVRLATRSDIIYCTNEIVWGYCRHFSGGHVVGSIIWMNEGGKPCLRHTSPPHNSIWQLLCAVGITTGYGLDGRGAGVRVPVQEQFFPPLQLIQSDSGAHPVSYPMDTRTLSPGIKRPGGETDHSPPISAEVKTTWMYIPTPTYTFKAWCLIS
jgi:hypothetical protein